MRHLHRRLRPVEEDLLSILAQFTSAVSHGAQPSFATFKDIWVKRHFSWIFLGNNTDLTSDKFVQSLYAIVLDCLDIPIIEPADSRPPSPEAAQQQTAPEQAVVPHNQRGDPHSHAGDPHHQADDHHLHELLLGDDPDYEPPRALTEADINLGTGTDTDHHPNTAHDPAVDLASRDQAEGSVVKDSRQTALHLSHVGQAGTTLGQAGVEQPDTSQRQNGGEARQDGPALLLPSSAQLPLEQLAATQAAAGASHSHNLTSTPQLAGPAPTNRPQADPTLAAVSLLDALSDAPVGPTPSLGPKGQPPPLSSHAPMIDADTQLNSTHVVSNNSRQDQQLPATDSSAAAGSKPTSLTTSPTQSDEHTVGLSPHLFMTEADLLLDSPGPPPQLAPQLAPQPPPGSEAVEATSAGTVGTASHPGSLQVHPVSAASLAARALQRQQSLPATATILPPPPAAAPPPAPPAPRPPVLTRVYTKTTAHRRRPHPAKVPLATKVGSLYAVYCLHETQPGRVPVYLPLELLHQLLEVVKEAQAQHMPCDVVQVVAQLMHKKAFVVGAIRRPPRDSTADEASFQPPNRMAASSLMGVDAKARTQRDAVYHIQSMYRGLTVVGKLQGLCREYKQAKARAWRMAGVRGKPQSFANLTVGAKLAQLLHRATIKITPKIRPKKASRPLQARQRQQQQQRASHPDPQAENDRELDNLLESGFLELASDDEGPGARAGPSFSPHESDSAEEGEISGTDSDQEEGAGEDDLPGGGLMGLGFGINFAEVANSGELGEEFGDVVLDSKLAPGIKRALQRDRGRKRRRHLAEKGWDMFEKHLEQHPLGEFDMDPDISPGPQPNTDEDDSDFGPELLAVSALDKLVNSPPPSRPAPKRGKRVRISPDDETCQAGATLSGLGAVAHRPTADSNMPEDAASREPGQQQQQKKKPGRPKGAKNKRKTEAVTEAAGAAPVADSAPTAPAKKRKKSSAAGPSDPSELLHRSDSAVHASSSQQAAVPSPETSVPHDRGLQSGLHPPPHASSLHALAASIAASVRLPPLNKQLSKPAKQPAKQLAKQPAKQAQQPAKQAQQPLQQLPQQSFRQLQEQLQHQPTDAVTTKAAEAPSTNHAAEPDTEYLHSAMATIHALLDQSDSD